MVFRIDDLGSPFPEQRSPDAQGPVNPSEYSDDNPAEFIDEEDIDSFDEEYIPPLRIR